MSIHYALRENCLTGNPDDFKADVRITSSAGLESIIARMVERGSTTARADILAVLEDAIGATEAMLLEGMRVNLGGLVQLFPRLRGVFDGPLDPFDATRHTIDVGAVPGSRVRRTVRANASLTREEAIKPAPNPVQYVDTGSGTTNAEVTPGNIGEVLGARLVFDEGQADEGIYFVPDVGLPVKVTDISRNKPSGLTFLVPSLTPGDYQVEVRARLNGGTELRTGRLDVTLTVA